MFSYSAFCLLEFTFYLVIIANMVDFTNDHLICGKNVPLSGKPLF